MVLLTEGQSMERLFDLDFQLLADSVLTIIAVAVLFFFVSYFLFNPARKLLANRQEKIRGELEDAKTNMEEAQKLREEYETRLKDIQKEAEEILGEARRHALVNEGEIIAKAREEAARIVERAKAEALLEKQKMADDVKKEIITVAAAMAGKLVTASMSNELQDRLIDETLKEIGDGTWLS